MYTGEPERAIGFVSAGVPNDSASLATLYQMRDMVRKGVERPIVVSVARHIVAGLSGRDQLAQAFAIREWMETHVRFIPDPNNVEVPRPPDEMLEEVESRFTVQGDCDEAAIIGAALASAVGLTVDLVVVGFDTPNTPYSHVFALVKTPGGNVDLDTTRSVPDLGWRISRRFVVPV